MSTDNQLDGPWRPLRSWEGTPEEVEASFIDFMGEPTLSLTTFALKHALQLTRGHVPEAEDLVQHALLRIYGTAHARPISNPRGWVRRVVTNKHLDNLDRAQTQTDHLGDRTGYDVALDEAVGDRADENPAEAAVASAAWAEIRTRIDAVCATLDEDQQTVLRALVDPDTGGLRTIEEIMNKTGFSKSKVKRRRTQAMQTLRDLLDDPDDQSGAGIPA